MKRNTLTALVALALTAGLFHVPQARACIPIPHADTEVNLTSRRTLINIEDDGAFSMTFQNQYQGDMDDFAWLIPLPGVPAGEPEAVETDILDQLSIYTTPMILTRPCVIPCISVGSMDATYRAPSNAIDAPVDIWMAGTLGDLVYQVITADDAAGLYDWLQANSFPVTADLQPALDRYVSQGWAFFVAQVIPGSAMGSVPLVQFSFDSTTPLSYPMYITSFSVKDLLDMHIFVVGPTSYLPTNYAYEPLGVTEMLNMEAYETEASAVMAKNSNRNFLVEYSQSLANSGSWYPYDQMVRDATNFHEPWDDELMAWQGEGRHLLRLRARMSGNAMDEDLSLEASAEALAVSNTYDLECPGGVVYETCEDIAPTDDPDAGAPMSEDPEDPEDPGDDDPAKGESVGSDDEGGCSLGGSGGGLGGLALMLLALLALRRRK